MRVPSRLLKVGSPSSTWRCEHWVEVVIRCLKKTKRKQYPALHLANWWHLNGVVGMYSVAKKGDLRRTCSYQESKWGALAQCTFYPYYHWSSNLLLARMWTAKGATTTHNSTHKNTGFPELAGHHDARGDRWLAWSNGTIYASATHQGASR